MCRGPRAPAVAAFLPDFARSVFTGEGAHFPASERCTSPIRAHRRHCGLVRRLCPLNTATGPWGASACCSGKPALPSPTARPDLSASGPPAVVRLEAHGCLSSTVQQRTDEPADLGNPCRTRALPTVAFFPFGTFHRPGYDWAQRREIPRVGTHTINSEKALRARMTEYPSGGKMPAKRTCVRV